MPRRPSEWEAEMGKRLKALRRAAGLSQARLAEASGVPVGTLRGWEYGRRTPLLDAAARVAVALGCTLGQLGGTEPLPAAAGKARGKRATKEGRGA
jgi:transcriptional regulator with XRE-family HTH domain